MKAQDISMKIREARAKHVIKLNVNLEASMTTMTEERDELLKKLGLTQAELGSLKKVLEIRDQSLREY
jgi:hypothetical protein